MKSGVDIKDEKTRSVPLDQQCRRFTMSELVSATDKFDNKWCIGHGGFGKVYKGKMSDGPISTYAIKRLNFLSDQGEPEFWAEIDMLSRLRHCNLVSLIGYCDEEQEMALVYEYMHNGTLYDHLHKKGTHLTWSQRLKICIGAARGLDYLHNGTGTQQGVIHRDVKSSNILLDGNYAAKISDFGLAKIGPTNQTRTYVSTIVKGTFGYMDPTYFFTGRVTRKSDVYAFGVVLLEVLCGRRALDESLDEGLAMWAQDQIKQGKITRIIDSRLRDYISKRSLKEFSCVAVRCLHSNPNLRPTMSEIVSSLELALSLQEKKASTRRVINVKNLWSLLSHKGRFEFRSLWTTGRSNRLPAIEGLQIVGDAFPGGELIVCGYSVNGADSCMFQWVQCTPDGSSRVYKSTTPNITVSLDDVGTCLHVEVIPVDLKGRKGRLYQCLANDGYPINPVDPIEETVTVPVSDIETEAEVIQTVPLRGQGDSTNPLPSIKSLQITGNAYPGGTVEVRGFSINGTVSCFLHWFHQLQDGSIEYIKGARVEVYTVTSSDIGTYLGVEVVPTDKKGRQGRLYQCFANNGYPINHIDFIDEIVTVPVLDSETEGIQTVPLKGQNDSNNPLPSIKSLQITGNAYPGGTVEVRGFSINGTVSCFLRWFHQLQDGSTEYIKGATVETYTVTSSDTGTYLGVEVVPTDKNGRKGISFKCFANNESLITDSIEFLDDMI